MKPQIVRRQVAGKVIPPVMQRTTVQLSSEGTRSSHWTHQAQKKFSHFIWHRNKLFVFQVKKKTIEVCPGRSNFFPPNTSKQYSDFKVPTAQTPSYSLCMWLIQTISTDCKCKQIVISAVQLFLSWQQNSASITLFEFYCIFKRTFILCKA